VSFAVPLFRPCGVRLLVRLNINPVASPLPFQGFWVVSLSFPQSRALVGISSNFSSSHFLHPAFVRFPSGGSVSQSPQESVQQLPPHRSFEDFRNVRPAAPPPCVPCPSSFVFASPPKHNVWCSSTFPDSVVLVSFFFAFFRPGSAFQACCR